MEESGDPPLNKNCWTVGVIAGKHVACVGKSTAAPCVSLNARSMAIDPPQSITYVEVQLFIPMKAALYKLLVLYSEVPLCDIPFTFLMGKIKCFVHCVQWNPSLKCKNLDTFSHPNVTP